MRLAWSSAVAVALHVALLWALAPGEVLAERRPPRPVELTWVEVPAVAAPQAPTEQPLPAPPPRQARRGRAPSKEAAPQPAEPLAPLAPPAPPEVVPTTAVEEGLAVGSLAPAAEPGPAEAGELGSRTGTPEGDALGAVEDDGAWFAGYQSTVFRRVVASRRYPAQARRLGLVGTTTVRFCVRRDGHLACPPTVQNPSHPLLDDAALRIVQAAAPFPPLPSFASREVVHFNVDIRFSLE